MCSVQYLPSAGLPNNPSWVVFNPAFFGVWYVVFNIFVECYVFYIVDAVEENCQCCLTKLYCTE